MNPLTLAGGVAVLALLGIVALSVFIAMFWRIVVPTNEVHIVQSGRNSISYGSGLAGGNSYYEFPSWIPKIGVTVSKFPLSVFDLNLMNYDAYDQDRLEFMVDVRAFFRISDSQIAAQRVGTFQELKDQLNGVLQGAVRNVLAKYTLDHIMTDRATMGKEFSSVVDEGLREWGVQTVKTIEFMNIRDAQNSQVIHNIMAKKKSFIEMESRVEVAKNMQDAETKEIEAQRQVALSKTEAQQQVGIRNAEMEKTVGIAKEKSNQEVQAEAKVTTERQMEVQKVQQVKQAEINKEVALVQAEQEQRVQVVQAEAEKQALATIAAGKLEATKKDAEGIQAVGEAKAAAESALLLAPVNAQLTLAKEIGENQSYQAYLIEVRKVEATESVGKEMAAAMAKADLKVIANSGSVQNGVASLGDIFTPAGGTSIAGMLEALAQTDQGKALVAGVTAKLGGSPVDDKAAAKTVKK